MALMCDIKFCRILRKGTKFYVQLTLQGHPPVKINKETGEVRHTVGSSRVGIDIGPQTIAVTSDHNVSLRELAHEINAPYREIKRLQRRMDRSRRANNPNKYNDNGTIKRGNKDPWKKSEHYLKDQHKLMRIHSKLKDIRKQSHCRLANEIIAQGTEVYVELMSFKGMQRRSKKTTTNAKGKINKKKRFGKSLANKAPAAALTILDNKLKAHGTELHYINTAEVKASQYNHLADSYTKKKLSERWAMIGEHRMQRDMYSSFLIMNVNSDLKSINKEQCYEKFERFRKMHDAEITRLIASPNRKIGSMGI